MSLLQRAAAVAAVAAAAAMAVPAWAGSLAGSSAAGGSSASSAASESVEGSSNSSARAVAAADGPYRVAELAPVPDRPDVLRLTLQPLAGATGDGPLRLVVPRQAVERGGVAEGGTVLAAQRAYGVAFANGVTRREFFLVIAEDWHRELRATPVAL
ncbi:MAG: hypothetical protein RJA99_659 [Pseudomonadota bacterium]|jgi:hypothetical protein